MPRFDCPEFFLIVVVSNGWHCAAPYFWSSVWSERANKVREREKGGMNFGLVPGVHQGLSIGRTGQELLCSGSEHSGTIHLGIVESIIRENEPKI